MEFLRDITGLVLTTTVATVIAYFSHLELFAAIAVGIQWVVALLYAIPKKDERLFDLTGAITYAIVSLLAYLYIDNHCWRDAILVGMVWIWCVRLGSFLFLRIRATGEDSRFTEIRANPVAFLSTWSLQGLWVFLTLLAMLLCVTHSTHDVDLHALDIVGVVLWLVGLIIEAMADYQKTRFRRDPNNKGKFIHSGLWYYSRHPNYCGEIMLWIGVYLMSVHSMTHVRYQILGAISPLFVILLLTTVSGIPMLEKQGQERWGDTEEYKQYIATTSVLLLLPPRKMHSELHNELLPSADQNLREIHR